MGNQNFYITNMRNKEMECDFCPKIMKWPEMDLKFRMVDQGQGTVRVVFCPSCGTMQQWRGQIIYRHEGYTPQVRQEIDKK